MNDTSDISIEAVPGVRRSWFARAPRMLERLPTRRVDVLNRYRPGVVVRTPGGHERRLGPSSIGVLPSRHATGCAVSFGRSARTPGPFAMTSPRRPGR